VVDPTRATAAGLEGRSMRIALPDAILIVSQQKAPLRGAAKRKEKSARTKAQIEKFANHTMFIYKDHVFQTFLLLRDIRIHGLVNSAVGSHPT
jgi:hypothetical protein